MTLLTDDELKAMRERDARRGELPPPPRIKSAADDAILGDTDQQVQRDRRALLRHIDALQEQLVALHDPQIVAALETGAAHLVTSGWLQGKATEPKLMEYAASLRALAAAIDAAKEPPC